MFLWKTVENSRLAISYSKLRITDRFKERRCRNRPKPSRESFSSVYGLSGGPSVRFMRWSNRQITGAESRWQKSQIIAYSFQHLTPSVNKLQDLSSTYTYSQQLSPIMSRLSFSNLEIS